MSPTHRHATTLGRRALGSAIAAAPLLATLPAAAPRAATPAPAASDITGLSTVFDAPAALAGWRELSVPGFPAKWHPPRIEAGRLVLQPHSSGWFEDMIGAHLSREVEGNFVVTTRLRVEGTRSLVPQTLFTLAGLFVRVPREGLSAATWQPGRENWLFFALGSAFPAGTPQFEIKTTWNSLSTLKIADAAFAFAGGARATSNCASRGRASCSACCTGSRARPSSPCTTSSSAPTCRRASMSG